MNISDQIDTIDQIDQIVGDENEATTGEDEMEMETTTGEDEMEMETTTGEDEMEMELKDYKNYEGRWGCRRIVDGGADDDQLNPKTFNLVNPEIVGLTEQELQESGRAEVSEALREAYASDENPYNPHDRPLRIVHDIGPLGPTKADRLAAELERQGVDVEALKAKGFDLSDLSDLL